MTFETLSTIHATLTDAQKRSEAFVDLYREDYYKVVDELAEKLGSEKEAIAAAKKLPAWTLYQNTSDTLSAISSALQEFERHEWR